MQPIDLKTSLAYLLRAIQFRAPFIKEPYDTAFRLLNGFTEHLPGLVIDIFAKTAIIHDYSEEGAPREFFLAVQNQLLQELPWLKTVLLKRRNGVTPEEKNGERLYGEAPDTQFQEFGVKYAVDLTLNQDNSFYNDTRHLRKWLLDNMNGRSMLNTFAYTGSLGIAALAGNASRLLQTDLSGRFLSLAEKSCALNAFPENRMQTETGDFFPVVSRLKKAGERFDCVVLDPPYFSKTSKGTIDMMHAPLAAINKVRPLVADNGHLIVVNNALFLSGEELLAQIDTICDGVYLTREDTIPIPSDFTGCEPGYKTLFQSDPSPFNHPTKIQVLRIRKKTGGNQLK